MRLLRQHLRLPLRNLLQRYPPQLRHTLPQPVLQALLGLGDNRCAVPQGIVQIKGHQTYRHALLRPLKQRIQCLLQAFYRNHLHTSRRLFGRIGFGHQCTLEAVFGGFF